MVFIACNVYQRFTIEYQSHKVTKANKGITKDQRTKGPKDQGIPKRKKDKKSKPKAKIQGKKKIGFFFLWPYPKKTGSKKRSGKGPKLYFLGTVNII
jgi:hypothetical protein